MDLDLVLLGGAMAAAVLAGLAGAARPTLKPVRVRSRNRRR